MMRDVFVVSDNILSPLGVTTEQNFAGLKKGQSGILWHENLKLSPTAFFASLFEDNAKFSDADDSYTKFEQLLIASISETLKNSVIDIRDSRTALIISSTKGN